MASKTKNTKAATVAQVGIAAIVAATNSPAGFMYVHKDEAQRLTAEGLAEVNMAIVNPQNPNEFATRATQKGKDSVTSASAGFGQPSQTAPASNQVEAETSEEDEGQEDEEDSKSKFVIDTGIPIPTISGRGGRAGVSIYPFDKMEVGNSFFVPKAAKNLASTISSANARYATPELDANGQPVMRQDKKGNDVPKTKMTRQFVVRSVTENGVSGSRIWRKA